MIKKFFKFVFYTCSILVVIIAILGLQFYQFLNSPLRIGAGGYVLVVPPGTSVQKIATQLSEEGVMKSELWFLLWLRYDGAWSKLKAGEYLIKAGTTPKELVEQLKEGKVIQHAITVVPGWDFDRLMLEINQSTHLIHTLTGLNQAEIIAKLDSPIEHPEGQFFPETYYFPAGTTDIAFLKRAHRLLHAKLASIWEKRAEALPLKSPYEALILASIIEKESSMSDEYSEIAGVYIRRIEKNMPLQADPTVIYGVGKEFNGRLNDIMLKNPTPYNTYRNIGLPPTPIALPSEMALEAAVQPKPGETLYFVANSDGRGHVFSKTLQEHNTAVTEYRRSLLGNK